MVGVKIVKEKNIGNVVQISRNTQRVLWVDVAKGICLALMVLGHYRGFPDGIKLWIYSFHMPAFFLLSGMLHRNVNSFPKFLIKKSRALLVPFIFWSGVMLVTSLVMNVPAGLSLIDGVIQTFLWNDPLSQPLWFLYTLFLTEIFYYPIQRMSNVNKVIVGGCLFLLGLYFAGTGVELPLRIQIIPTTLGFYLMGNLVLFKVMNLDWTEKRIIIFGIFSLIFYFFNYSLHGRYDIYMNSINSLHFYNGFVGSVLIFLFARFLGSKKGYLADKLVFVFQWLSLNAIVLLTFHSKFFWLATMLEKRVLIVEGTGIVQAGLNIVIFTLAFPVIIYFVNKIPWSVGKRKIG